MFIQHKCVEYVKNNCQDYLLYSNHFDYNKEKHSVKNFCIGPEEMAHQLRTLTFLTETEFDFQYLHWRLTMLYHQLEDDLTPVASVGNCTHKYILHDI